MELIKSNRNTALTKVSQEPWALAIRQQYGELPDFVQKFSIQTQRYCAQNMVKAVEDDLPTFGRIVATYGEEGIAGLINTHLTEAVLAMGEDRDVDPYDVQFIASAIVQSERFRLLRFPTVLGFFHLLKCGEFDIYGKVTPRKVLEAFRKYAVTALEKENRIAYEKEQRDRDDERPKHDARCVSWEVIRQRLRIKEPTMIEWIIADMNRENKKKEIINLAVEIIKGLILIFEVINEYKAKNSHKNTRNSQISHRNAQNDKLYIQ